MVASRADLETYDEVFDSWFRSLREETEPELSLEFNLPPDPEDFEFGDEPAARQRARRADRRQLAERRRGRGARRG